MKCSKCGELNPGKARFCLNCGADLLPEDVNIKDQTKDCENEKAETSVISAGNEHAKGSKKRKKNIRPVSG